MIGNVTQEREIAIGDSEINLGKIELAEDTKLLQEVVITGQKSQLTVNAERRVFNVSSNIAATGASADELLAAIPSVDVNSEGEISLRGNADVLVWINGKKIGMNDDNRAQILRQLPAEAIASIEVMTNPSSKHSTEGTAGIGLKNQHVPGGSVSRRSYDNGTYLNSDGDSKKHENSMFLCLGTNFRPDDRNDVYLSAIGTLGHKWGRTTTIHLSNVPGNGSAIKLRGGDYIPQPAVQTADTHHHIEPLQ